MDPKFANRLDLQPVRTPADLERKYNLSRLARLADRLEGAQLCSCPGSGETLVPVKLPADRWETMGENLYAQAVTLKGVNGYHKIDLDLSPEQLRKHSFAITLENAGGRITAYALGKKPLQDVTLQATVTGTGANLPVTKVKLPASQWETLKEDLHTQEGSLPGVNGYSRIDLDLSPEQLTAFRDQGFFLTMKNEDGAVTAFAVGSKPSQDISVQATILGTGASLPVTQVQLSGQLWQRMGSNLYAQKLALPGITSRSKIDLHLSPEQFAHFQEQNLGILAKNEDGVVTFYALGSKPQEDYILQATIKEVR